MADELNKSAEFTGKHQDEENPILIAQRYLNIFRQIHIFNKKRQDQFDDSLIEMSPDIRILLSTLPGGSLLLEHIAELEEKRGIIPNTLLDAEIAETKKATKEEKVFSSLKTNSKNSDNGALPGNLVKVLQQNEEKHAKDLQALTNAFLKSQENMADILRQALNIKTPEEKEQSQDTLAKESEKTSAKENKKTKENKEEKESKEAKEVKDTPETKEQNDSAEETSKPETTSKILSFTKKLFSGHKSESEESEKQDISSLIDTTPVSLDEIESEPVSLDVPDSEPVSLDISTPETKAEEKSDEQSSNEQSSDEDWEWEYVDEDENAPAEDDEWEYVEETDNAPSDDDDDEWEYVEDEEPAAEAATQNAPAEPLEDEEPITLEDNQTTYPDNIEGNDDTLPADQQWAYAEDGTDVLPEGQDWQYFETDPNALPENEQWAYTEDPNADYTYQYPAEGEQWEYPEDPATSPTDDESQS